MPTGPQRRASGRRPLSRERVLGTAIDLADKAGIDKLTMRKLGQTLGVEAMSLYNHVRNKEDLLDGLIDLVFAEVPLPSPDIAWKDAMRRRGVALREALSRHRWAVGLMESRTSPGPATLRHHDAVLGCLFAGGFSMELTAHAYAALDSYIYGFALQEQGLPMEGPEETAVLAEVMLAQFPADLFPNLAAFTTGHVLTPGYDFAAEFEFGLELLLDGLETAHAASHRETASRM
jgi:AcrR family transcriptional regulator